MKIYVAGPYTPTPDVNIHDAARVAHKNTLNAIRAGIRIIEKGHIAFIPHLSHYVHLETEHGLPKEYYYQYDMEWLKHCDALFLLGHSNGADKELEWAQKNGLRIYYDLFDIPTVVRK
jgi:Domain of unknown function (DUF4406)